LVLSARPNGSKCIVQVLGKMALHFIKGNALYPNAPGNKIIVHICNDIGVWGGGFTKSLSRRWKEPEAAYRRSKSRKLGSVEFVQTESDIWVANVIGQHSIITRTRSKDTPPIRYEAVRNALKVVAEKSLEFQATVHMPRIGCGLAGGKWEEIEPIIRDELIFAGINVSVYDLESNQAVKRSKCC